MQIPTHAAFFGGVGDAGETIESIYGPERLAAVGRMTRLFPHIVNRENIEELLPELHDLEVIFCTWGMFPLTDAQLDRMPNLRAVFYAAGSVRQFAPALLRRGVSVTSAWAANAVPVAEFVLGQILLANKGYYRNLNENDGTGSLLKAFRGRGNFGATISLLGAGQIGRKLIELLRTFHLRVVCFDPYLSQKGAEILGVEKVELDEAFAMGDVVSNHMADVPATRKLIDSTLLRSMPANATFINTGRGRTVDHDHLFEVMNARPDLTALLDVTEPEPLPADAPLRRLPNVRITSHIAGSIGDEWARNAELALQEFCAWREGRPLRYAMTLQMLETMA